MRAFLLIFTPFLFFGCKNDEKIPKGILKQDQMRKVMWDLMRADAYVSDFIIKDTTRNQKKESIIFYEKVFAIHSTSRETFKKSLVFYEAHPDLMKPISDSLRNDEKRSQEYQNHHKPFQVDSTIKKVDSTIKKFRPRKKMLKTTNAPT